MADAIFALPRLAAIYDALDGDRDDLDTYGAIVAELGAASVVDLGCGTGSFACRLAASGLHVIGVDPAAASIDVARGKPGANAVQWILGDATSLPPSTRVDLIVMTGNVAQVFVEDDDWATTMQRCAAALTPGGWLVFESRDPARAAWTTWNRSSSFRSTELDGVGIVDSWVECTSVALPLVSFRWTFSFHADQSVVTSDSTLRFREKHELTESVTRAGFTVIDIRDAPDRPGSEFVFIARRDGLRDGLGDRRTHR